MDLSSAPGRLLNVQETILHEGRRRQVKGGISFLDTQYPAAMWQLPKALSAILLLISARPGLALGDLPAGDTSCTWCTPSSCAPPAALVGRIQRDYVI